MAPSPARRIEGRRQLQVVEPATASGLEPGGGLAGDPAGLLGGQAALLEQVREGVRLAQRFLDEVRDAFGPAHVQDAHEAVVVDPGGAAGRVERGVGVGVVGGEDHDDDIALERQVVGRPPLGPRLLRQAPLHGIPPAEHRRRPYAVHG